MDNYKIIRCGGNEEEFKVSVQLAAEQELLSVHGSLDDIPEEGPIGWETNRTFVSTFLWGAETFLAVKDGKYIGIVSGVAAPEENDPYGYLSFLYVRKEYRRQGIGTALLQHIEPYFIEHKCRHIKINLSFSDIDAKPFLEKLGYEQRYIAMVKPARRVEQLKQP